VDARATLMTESRMQRELSSSPLTTPMPGPASPAFWGSSVSRTRPAAFSASSRRKLHGRESTRLM
jgi:hypothetical protein